MGCLRLPYQTELKILIAQDHNHGLRIVYSHSQQANTWNNLNNGLDIDRDQDNDNIADWAEEIATDDWAWFTRGYTGHACAERSRSKMLPEFGLINMPVLSEVEVNGRAYDPVLGRMLQVDNYIQNPFSSQSYNRYSYVLNNPLKYVDPSGEFIGTIITGLWDLGETIFTKGGLEFWNWNKSDYVKSAWRHFDPGRKGSKTNKAWRIDSGLFKTDGNRTVAGNIIMLVSRFTWELPQTILGNIFSHARNINDNVTDVSYYGGATLVNNDRKTGRWGATSGNYINGQHLDAAPYTDQLFRHEYGHTLQSRLMGPLYLPSVAIPSLIGSGLDMIGEDSPLSFLQHNHDDEWNEIKANRMALRYFENQDPNSLITDPNTGRGIPWNNNDYPREYVYDWYFSIFHPSPIIAWWLVF